jgi:hypothetical protein
MLIFHKFLELENERTKQRMLIRNKVSKKAQDNMYKLNVQTVCHALNLKFRSVRKTYNNYVSYKT